MSLHEGDLRNIPAKRLILDAPMRDHTTFRIGGPADALVIPESGEEAGAVLRYCHDKGLPVFPIGNGSNLLVKDGGIRGVVLRIAEGMAWMRVDGDTVVAGAGVTLHDLAEFAYRHSLGGLEFASGIPGTLGGAIFMNAGAYGGEMKDVICRVEAVDMMGNPVTLTGDGIAFGYRDSALQQRGLLAVEASARLTVADKADILAQMGELNEKRRTKQPLNMPSAGSTFKRPPGKFAGSLIEKAGLKGYRVGGAQVSTLHAGFVVNLGGASSRDVLRLIEDVRKRVFDLEGVLLEPEVRIVGED